MSGSGRVLRNIFSGWAGMGVSMVLSFISAPIVIGGLGSSWYGIWILVSQLTGYSWLFDLGVREAVVRYVSKYLPQKDYRKINEIVSSAIYLYLLIGVLTMVLISVLVILLPLFFNLDLHVVSIARIVLLVNGFNIAISWFFNPYQGILMGLQRFDIFQKIGIGMGIVNFVLVITFIKTGYGIISLSLIGFCVNMVSNVLIYWQCRRLLPEFRLLPFDVDKMHFRSLLNYGKYVLMNNIGTKIATGTDALLIGIFLQASAITYYAIPNTLTNYMKNLVSTSTWVLNPLFSELESRKDTDRIESLLVEASKFSLLIGLPIGIVYLIMGKTFISLWIGNEYGERVGMVLIILTIASLLSLQQHVMTSMLYGLSRHKIIAYLKFGEAVVGVILIVVFIELWGILGVAVGGGIALVLFMGVILPLVVCRSLNIQFLKYMKESIVLPIISSMPFAVCCYLIGKLFPASSLIGFFASVFCILPVFLICAWFISFSAVQRHHYIDEAYRHIPALKRRKMQ
jgi:O-antigen/teichoic acid export membrane protein